MIRAPAEAARNTRSATEREAFRRSRRVESSSVYTEPHAAAEAWTGQRNGVGGLQHDRNGDLYRNRIPGGAARLPWLDPGDLRNRRSVRSLGSPVLQRAGYQLPELRRRVRV